jgi:hypothetical protein
MELFKTCPRKYQLAIIEGWTPTKTAPPLVFGGLLHRYLEAYDRRRLTGASHYDTLTEVVAQALRETVRRINGLLLPDGEIREVAPGTEGSQEILTSWRTTTARQTSSKHHLVHRAVAVNDPLHHPPFLRQPAPRSPASMLSAPRWRPFHIPGHIDKICEFAGDLYIQERKHTTATLGDWYFIKYSIDAQTTGYLTAGKVLLDKPIAGIIVDACQVGVTFSRIQRHVAPRTPAQLEEWLSNTQEWISLAQYYAKRYGAKPWPLNEASCHKYSGCQYRGVCSRDPEHRPMLSSKIFPAAGTLEIRRAEMIEQLMTSEQVEELHASLDAHAAAAKLETMYLRQECTQPAIDELIGVKERIIIARGAGMATSSVSTLTA